MTERRDGPDEDQKDCFLLKCSHAVSLNSSGNEIVLTRVQTGRGAG